MKNKNVLIILAGAALCVTSVLLLLGFIGISAEKSGTRELVPEITESETTHALANVLKETTQSEPDMADGLRSEEELKTIWNQVYHGYSYYISADEDNASAASSTYHLIADAESQPAEPTDSATASITDASTAPAEDNSEQFSMNDAKLSASEAGLILLKEIDRLYPGSDLEHLSLPDIYLETDVGTNGQPYIQWTGMLESHDGNSDKNNLIYSFEIDAITGKIYHFSRTYSYLPGGPYLQTSWTDEKIIERAKELIETYHLADDANLDWETVKIFNGTKEIDSVTKELEEEPGLSVSIHNTLTFQKDGKKVFYFSMDFQTGAISYYIWPGRSMPIEMD